jgi:serine/threonine-protein kinase
MNCPRCNAEIPDKFKFCPECGTSIAAATRKSDVERDLSIGKMETQSRFAQISAGEVKTKIAEGGGEAFEAGKPLAERYELLEEIGHGGFARVWRARDKKLGRTVAVKRLLENTSSGPSGKQTLARFRREAQAIARLNHRNIVAVYDVDRDDQGDYLVMELVEGGSLREYLKAKKKLPAAEGVESFEAWRKDWPMPTKKAWFTATSSRPTSCWNAKEAATRPRSWISAWRGPARIRNCPDGIWPGHALLHAAGAAPRRQSVNHTADIYALGKTFYELLTGKFRIRWIRTKSRRPWPG